MDKLMTAKDIVEILGCSKEFAYVIIHMNGFPKIKIGRRYYVVKKDWDTWLSNHIGKTVQI